MQSTAPTPLPTPVQSIASPGENEGLLKKAFKPMTKLLFDLEDIMKTIHTHIFSCSKLIQIDSVVEFIHEIKYDMSPYDRHFSVVENFGLKPLQGHKTNNIH